MVANAQQRAAVPEPPGFLATLWDVFVAFLLAGIGVAAASVAALLAGVVGFSSSGAGPDPLDWPFVHAGAWSLAANVVVTSAVLVLCAVAISRRLARRAEEPVSWLRLFAIVALTGYAPFVAYHGLVPLHFLLGLLVTAFLARVWAVGAEPPRISGRTRTTLAVGAAALLCVPVAYGATHPVWYGSYVGGIGPQPHWGENRILLSPRHARTFPYTFFLKNSSWAGVKILGVSGGSSRSYPFLRVVRAERGFFFPGRSARPIRGVTMGHAQDQALTIFIRTLGCAGSSGTFTLDRVNVRYRLAGVTLSQPVALAMQPTVVCP
jgi:hypothetical protein